MVEKKSFLMQALCYINFVLFVYRAPARLYATVEPSVLLCVALWFLSFVLLKHFFIYHRVWFLVKAKLIMRKKIRSQPQDRRWQWRVLRDGGIGHQSHLSAHLFSKSIFLLLKSHSHFWLLTFYSPSQWLESHFPRAKTSQSQFPFYPFRTQQWNHWNDCRGCRSE